MYYTLNMRHILALSSFDIKENDETLMTAFLRRRRR